MSLYSGASSNAYRLFVPKNAASISARSVSMSHIDQSLQAASARHAEVNGSVLVSTPLLHQFS